MPNDSPKKRDILGRLYRPLTVPVTAVDGETLDPAENFEAQALVIGVMDSAGAVTILGPTGSLPTADADLVATVQQLIDAQAETSPVQDFTPTPIVTLSIGVTVTTEREILPANPGRQRLQVINVQPKSVDRRAWVTIDGSAAVAEECYPLDVLAFIDEPVPDAVRAVSDTGSPVKLLVVEWSLPVTA